MPAGSAAGRGMNMVAQFDFFHYLPVSNHAMEWGMYVTGAGRTRIAPAADYPPGKHPSLYQFDWRRGRTLPEFHRRRGHFRIEADR